MSSDAETRDRAQQSYSDAPMPLRDYAGLTALFNYEEPAGHGELEEHARGTGMRRAVGQLLTCPYCISQSSR